MNCLIIVDSGKKVGNGHVSRSKILTKELIKFFNITIASPNNFIVNKKINFIKLNNFNFDNNAVKKIFKTNYNTVIIDSYRKKKFILKLTKNISKNIFIFDDYLEINNYKYNIINQNPFFSKKDYPYIKNRYIFAGKNYTLINRNLPKVTPSYKKFKILITCGMYDQKNKLPKIIDFFNYLTQNKTNNLDITIYINKNAKNLKIIQKKIKNIKNIKIQTNQKNYLKKLCKSNISISPVGVSIWERLFIGIPTMAFPINKKQQNIYSRLIKHQYILPFLINNNKRNYNYFKNEKMLKQKLIKLSKKGKKLFSLNNSQKLAKKIYEISHKEK